MVNQQKGMQQETAYSAVVVNDHMYPRPCLHISSFHVSMTPYDIGTGIRDRLDMLTVRVAVLQYSQLHKKDSL